VYDRWRVTAKAKGCFHLVTQRQFSFGDPEAIGTTLPTTKARDEGKKLHR